MMPLQQIIGDKTIKAKEKVSTIGAWIANAEMPVDEFLAFAGKQNTTHKATCIEALEYATKKNAGIANSNLLAFVSKALKDEAPRVKWESAKVIANIAKLFPTALAPAVKNLLSNAESQGTVVRWATAFALSEIVKLKTTLSKKLLPAIVQLCEKETDHGVQKKYQEAINKLNK